ncbi:MAG: YbaB/EbfC family nucleoid-associated protein [Lentisphaeria bacterium]|nr:YbaB/EbfC family nucleoid-associated protein [Lentisphaeria bacterium]
MLGNFAEMAKLMGRAKEIQNEMKRFKEEMPNLEFSATGMNGAVKVVVSGDFAVKQIEIAPGAGNAPELAMEIQRAVNTALFSAKQNVQQRMADITGGIGIDLPGLM